MKVMFCPINYVGPINAAIGMGEVVRDVGHKVIFAIKSDWIGKLKIHGFEEGIIGPINETKENTSDSGSAQTNAEDSSFLLGPETNLEKMKLFNKEFSKISVKKAHSDEPYLEEIIKRVKPDVIVADEYYWKPSIMDLGIPWVWVMTSNPLTFEIGINEEILPPMCLGMKSSNIIVIHIIYYKLIDLKVCQQKEIQMNGKE